MVNPLKAKKMFKKEAAFAMVVFLFIFIVVDLYLMGMLAHFAVYGYSQQNFLKIILYLVSDLQARKIWLGENAFLAALVILFVFNKKWNIKQVKFEKDISKGSSSWASLREISSKFSIGSSSGIIFGEYKSKPLILPAEAYENRNVAVFGPPDTGKSRSYVRLNLLHAVESGWSVVVTDPKGELARDFRIWLQQQGYTVKIFNLVSFVHSDRWNPLDEVKDEMDAQLLCEVIIRSTTVPGRKKGDEFWDRVEMNLLKALVLYVIEMEESRRNIGTVYSLLASGDSSTLKNLFSVLPEDHPAKAPYNIYEEMAATVKAGAISGLGTRLQVFQNQMVRSFTSHSDISLTLPGNKKCAYFCILSDTDSTFYFLSSLFFSFLFIKLTRLADMTGGTLKVPVNFLMDEFCNIGHIPDFTKKLSTMRSRGIGCSVVFQSIPQLKEFYPGTAWETILANCAVWLVMGVKDLTTAEYISKYAGKGTITVESHTKERGRIFDFGRDTFSLAERMVIAPDELFRLKKSEGIVLASGIRPVKITKMDFAKHRRFGELQPESIEKYIPGWFGTQKFQISSGKKEKNLSSEENETIGMNKTKKQHSGPKSPDPFWGV